MKIAVTGGSGQLGTLVLKRLAADRAVQEIVSLDVKPPRIASRKLRAVTADVRDAGLGRHLEGCDAVIHLAFIVVGLPGATFDAVNFGGSRNVFESAATAGVRKIIYSSSIAAYGVLPGHPIPLVESSPRRFHPGFAYSAAKYRVEELLDGFEKEHPEIAVVRMRPGILIGAHMEHSLGDALRRRIMIDFGDTPAPVVWDEDVADAIVLALKKDVRGAFNLMADDPQPVSRFAAIANLRLLRPPSALVSGVQRLLPLLARVGVGHAEDPAWLDNLHVTMVMDCSRAKAELGWKPRCRTAVDVMRHYLEVVPARTDPRLLVFFRLLSFVRRPGDMPADMARLEARLHLALTGPGGGDFDIALRHGKLAIHAGVPRPPDVTVTLKASVFLDLLAGRMDYSTAVLTGKIRTEGEALAGMVVQGIVTGFRQQAKEAGVAGWPVRRFVAWMEKSEGAQA
jgi:nucleoside-diphosphate-sugar epimerase/putative sterol carrier protein